MKDVEKAEEFHRLHQAPQLRPGYCLQPNGERCLVRHHVNRSLWHEHADDPHNREHEDESDCKMNGPEDLPGRADCNRNRIAVSTAL